MFCWAWTILLFGKLFLDLGIATNFKGCPTESKTSDGSSLASSRTTQSLCPLDRNVNKFGGDFPPQPAAVAVVRLKCGSCSLVGSIYNPSFKPQH